MGISGLLPFLEKASRRCNVAEFRGCTVAIDAYCWLHKGAFGCAEKLVRGEDTNGYVLYCLKYIKMLRSYDIHPILVFDGQHLPAKKGIEEKRKQARHSSRQKVRELLRIGKFEEARACMKSCVNITHKMALALIKECRENGIDCIVAPYEADAQLAYLNIKNYVDLVITEDSDLLLFGCDKVLFKMDIQGFGTLVEGNKIGLCMKLTQDKYNFNKFRYMCILSGCDYLESLPGIGIKKALKFITLTANPDIYSVLVKLPSYLNLPNTTVTDDYRERFMIADATFQHQIVFDPVKRELVSLHDPKAAGTNEEYCKDAGSFFDNKIAFQMALGNIDPFTREKCDNWTPDEVALPRTSVWSYHYRKQTPSKKKKVEEKLNVNEIKNPNDEIKKVQTAEQLDYDTNLEAELKVYGTLRSETKKRKIIDEANAVEMFKKQEELNEVEQADSKNLGSKDETIDTVKEKEIKMPFRKSRKLSKFEPTIINYEEQTITSRFFAGKKVAQSPPPNRGADCDSLLSSIGDYAKKQTSLKLDETDAHKQDNNNVITYRINSDGKYTDINSLFISLHTPILFDNYKYAYNSFAPKISETPLNCVEEKCFSEATDDERNCNSDDIIEESPVEMKDDKSSNSKKLSEFTATKKKRLINFEKNDKSTTKLYSSESIESKQIENDKNIINVVEETSDVVIKTGEEVSINSDECVIMEKITRNESQDVSKNDDLPSSNVETEVKKKSLSPIISNKQNSSYKKYGTMNKSRKKSQTSGKQMDLRSMFSAMKKT